MNNLNLQENSCILNSLYLSNSTCEGEKYAKMIQSISSDNCVHRYNIMILSLFDPELQLINPKTVFQKIYLLEGGWNSGFL